MSSPAREACVTVEQLGVELYGEGEVFDAFSYVELNCVSVSSCCLWCSLIIDSDLILMTF